MDILDFFNQSKTFGGVYCKGNYDLDLIVLSKLLNHYVNTGKNYLDDYSAIVYTKWEGGEAWYNTEDHDRLLSSLSKIRRLKLISTDDVLDVKHIIKTGYKRYLNWLDRQYNAPRREACAYTNKREVKEYIYKKYGNNCLCCGSDDDLTIDHVIPINKGGKNELDNLQPLCRSCNSKKGIDIIDYRKEVCNG